MTQLMAVPGDSDGCRSYVKRRPPVPNPLHC